MYSVEEMESCQGFYNFDFLFQCEHRFWRSYHKATSAKELNSCRSISFAAFNFLSRMRENHFERNAYIRVEGPIPEILKYDCYRTIAQYDRVNGFPSVWILSAGDGKKNPWESRMGNGIYQWNVLTGECFPVAFQEKMI